MRRRLPGVLLALVLACAAAPGTAPARSLSSGGYSRPSISSYSRPPSGRSYFAPSGRGGSGGYALPTRRPSTGYGAAPFSGGDTAISRQFSGRALQQYRAGQTQPAIPPTTGYGAPEYRRPSTYGPGEYGSAQPRPWRPVYAPPSYGWAQQGRHFGVWDGLMLWSLLNSLSAPGHAAFFYNNQNSPAYRQWREEAQRAAATDPTVQARLTELDQRLAGMRGQPIKPGAPPPPAARSSGGGGLTGIIVVVLLVAAFLALWYWRRQSGVTGATPVVSEALKGSALTRFRVGMAIEVDPAPFVLAAGATKIKPIAGGGLISIEAVGVLMDGAIPLNRLYLPGRDAFFQLHLGADGKPDECRYFSRIDEVIPASQEEWGVWLDPAQGLIGWPQFQTKDGKLYDRAWAPGNERIEPRALKETIQALDGASSRDLTAMLYWGPTGLASPAPEREYILVTAIDQGGQAWVEIHAGIDINPAALDLPAVALA